MEIYNESINDLLVPGKGNLKIKDDPNVTIIIILLPFCSTAWTWPS